MDFDETFSPVMQLESFRTLLVIAAHLDLEIHQMDIVGAYLNGNLIEEIYMKQIPRYKDGSKKVLHLKKTLYGLKQAGQVWNRRLHEALTQLGFTCLLMDTCVYVRHWGGKFSAIAFHVNDSAIFADADLINSIKSELKSKFNTRDLGELHQFVRITVTCNRSTHTITISQEQYICDILEHAGMPDCNPAPTPMSPKQTLEKFDGA